MKIFGYEFRKFEKDNTVITDAVETWCVKWYSLHKDLIDKGAPYAEIQSFITKESANMFAKELEDARKLLGDKGWDVRVYKQKSPTNKE